ncbi:MAG: sigma-70 family RNA polymerase sigma factor [Pseudomonadota bacterium]
MDFAPSSADDNHSEGSQAAGVTSRLKAVYDRYFDRLVGQLRARYGAGPPDPADIAQATFEKLASRNMLDDVANVEAFSWTTANNLMRNERRALRVRAAHASRESASDPHLQCDEFDPERVVMAREELQIVVEALQDMPERRREVFMACRIEGLNPREAGERLGISRSAAVRHLALATQFLAAQVARLDEQVPG